MKTKQFQFALGLVALMMFHLFPATALAANSDFTVVKQFEGDTINPATDSTYSQVKDKLKTGDVLLFVGFDPAGIGIMFLEMDILNIKPFTHVGIVFDLPASNGQPAGLYFWQAAPGDPKDPDRFGPDYIKGVPSDGAQMVSLDSLMAYVNTVPFDTEPMIVTVRPLEKALTSQEEADLLHYARTVSGRSFSYPTDGGMVVDYVAGAAGKQSGDESFFCSKLASQTFYEAGLIEEVITNSVLPGHFAITPDNPENKINFTIDNQFGQIIPIWPY